MRIIKLIVFGIIGFVLGIGLWKIAESGYLLAWEKLSTPPHAVTELIPTGEPPFYIKTSDGSTYRYSSWHNEGWIKDTVPQDIANPFEIGKPCNLWSPEFIPPSNAPKSIIDCFQEKTMEADGYIKYAVVIDSDGNIWEWMHIVTPDYLIAMICFPLLGLVMGLVIGLFTAFVLPSQNGNNAKHNTSTSEKAG